MNKFIKSDLYRYAGNVSLKSFFIVIERKQDLDFLWHLDL